MMTFMFELLHMIFKSTKSDILMHKIHPTPDGYVCEIEDIGHDHQRYILTIRPKREGEQI
jgi:hypothetical protein